MHKPLAAALLVAAAPAAFAQLAFQYIELSASFVAYERDAGDVDGDGRNDIVAVSDGGSEVRVFYAPDWTSQTLLTFTGTYAYSRADDFKVRDIDGDGDHDLVVRLGTAPTSNGEGRMAWIENTGGGTGWVTRLVGTTPTYGKDIVVEDLDRDDRPDLVLREDSLTTVWFQEAGGAWTPVAIGHAPHEGMEVADLDHDGDPDIILNGFWYPTPDTPAAARNPANYTARTIDNQWFTQTGDWTANSCKVAAGDLDGDGVLDPVFSQSERSGYQVTWYRNPDPTNDAGWVAHPVAQIDYAHNLQAVDFDLDGDTDLLAGGMPQSQHKGLRLFLNEGEGTNWSVMILQSDGSYSAELGDIDEDGDPDILGIVNWSDETGFPTYLYRNNSAGPASLDFWRYIEVSDAHVRTFGLAFADVDGDDDTDIASGPWVYRNPGPPMTSAWSRVALTNGVHAFATLDVDGDALADLIAMKDNPGANRLDFYWYEANDPAATAWTAIARLGEVARSDHAEGLQGSAVGDVFSGGRPELVVAAMDGLYAFAIPAAPEAGAWPRTFLAARDTDEGFGLADIDDDNDLDLAFTRADDDSVRWAANPGDGSGNWPVHLIGTFPEADWPDRCLATDLNGDGRPDIVATEENSGVTNDALAVWWEQPAASPTNANWTRHILATRYTLNNLDLADMDRDGDTDVVLAEHRGTENIEVFENDGAGTFASHLVDVGKESHLGGRTVDLDGDGDLDLVSIAYDDNTKLRVWRNDSPSGAPRAARPVFSPPGGTFDEPLAATLTCATAGAEIWYTADGSDPTNQPGPSMLYTGAPIAVATTVTLKARAFAVDMDPSLTATASFTGPRAATPVIDPAGASFETSVTVSVTCATTGTVLRYTLDGGNPTPASALYTGPLTLTNTAILTVRAYRDGLEPSDAASASFVRRASGLVGYWRLDERFGPVAVDHSGQLRHGTYAGGIVHTNGRHDFAARLDGTDGRIDIPAFDVAGTGLTLSAWIRLPAGHVLHDDRIVSKAVGSGEQDHTWMLSLSDVSGARRLRFRLKTQGTTSTLIANAGNLQLETWYHAAAVYDGAAMRLYLDGADVGTLPKTGDITENPAAAIQLGANPPDAYSPLDGHLDDVRIYNLALTPAEIQQLAQTDIDRPAPAWLTFDPQTGFTVRADQGHYLHLDASTNLVTGNWRWMATYPGSNNLITILPTSSAPVESYRTRQE